MRYLSKLNFLVAFSLLAAAPGLGQINPANLTITGYQLISEQRLTRTTSYFSYRADVINTGPSLPAITATASSGNPAAVVVPGLGNLHFASAPQNVQTTSANVFTLLVDKTQNFSISSLRWSFVAPVANAGPAQTASVGQTVHLDASKSANPSGLGTLTYAWGFQTVPAGSKATITNPTAINPTFVPDLLGDYVVNVIVNNGSGTDGASVKISTTNSGPVADAGPNQTVTAGTTVTLNGSNSHDVDGDPLTYSWTLVQIPAGSQAVLKGATTVMPTFVADLTGTYLAQLVVNDGGTSSPPSFVTITTNPGHTRPVAIASTPSATVAVGATVQLDGSRSTDVDGNPLTYKWSLITVPQNSKAVPNNPAAVSPTFIADLAGTYVAQLIVNDGFNDSLPSTVTVSTITTTILPPVANAGPAQMVFPGAAVTLSGSGTDPQSLPLTFRWSLSRPANSTAVLSNPTIANPTFVADLPGAYVAQLIVNNGTLDSTPSTVTITSTPPTPVAVATTATPIVFPGATVTLDGTGSSDAAHFPLTYKWSLLNKPAGSNATLVGATSAKPTFVADLAGSYVAQLIVNNGFLDSAPVTVTATANPGNAITLTPNTLNLSNAPGTLTVTIGTAAGPGGLVVKLAIIDTTVATAPATVTIPANQTSATVSITPVGLGTTSILASSTGFQSGSATITVGNSTSALTLSASSVGITQTVTGTITLSSPAQSAITSALSVSTAGIVTVPATVNIAAGSSTGTFMVTGVAKGSTTITETTPGYGSDNKTIQVVPLGAITLQGAVGVVGAGQSVPFAVALVTPAPTGGVTVNLVSDSAVLTISPSVFIKQGATVPDVAAQITGVNIGTANITASANGFTPDTKSVQVAANLSFSPSTLTLATGASQTLTLTLSGPAPAGGLNVTLQSSSPAVASVPASVTIPQNTTTANVQVTAGTTTGTTTITASSTVAGIVSGTATIGVVNTIAINAPLPAGVVGVPYNFVVTATGGTTPYTFTATGLPAGLSITGAGVISGTPTTAGSGPATITVTDSTAGTHLTATATPTVVISPALTITTASLPAGVVGNPYNVQVAATGGNGAYTFTATGLPGGLSINSAGLISGTPTTAGPFTAAITVTDSTTPKVSTTANLGITISGVVSITTTALPNGAVNVPYSFTVLATGGTTPYSFTATGLPSGLSINAAGVISGTPTVSAAATPVVISVTDSTNPTHGTATVTLPITIAQAVAVTSTALPAGTMGVPYSFQVVASGGTSPYTFTATGLPANLTISSTGLISGTPAAAGSSQVVITATDSSAAHQQGSATLTLVIGSPLTITTTSLPAGTQNSPYTAFQVVATGGTMPYTFTASGLPAGLGISPTGVISGTPTATAQNAPVVITVTDSTPGTHLTATANLTITIAPPPLSITTTSLPAGTQNTPYTAFQVLATGGTTPYTFTATGLPAGLGISATGVISGTPTASVINAPVVITVTDSTPGTHLTATANLTITIAPPGLAITTNSLPSGTQNSPYTAFQVLATGGTAPLTFTATGLPAGLGISTTGVISGTPTVFVNNAPVVITVTDSTPGTHQTATANLTITIAPAPLVITTASLPAGLQNSAYTPFQIGATGGVTPYTFTASGLPAGLTISTGGSISGTPTVSGTFPVVVTVTDAASKTANANLSLIINPVTVTCPPCIAVTGTTVGFNLESPIVLTLTPATTAVTTITITSSNPSLVSIAGRDVDPDSGTVVLSVDAGTSSLSINARGLASSGSVTITASAQGYGTPGTATVTLGQSGFVLAGPNGIGGSFNLGQGASTNLTVSAALLDSSGNFVQVQPLRGGLVTAANPAPIAVNLAIGNPALGSFTQTLSNGNTVPVPPVANFTGGVNMVNIQFTAGNTQVSSTITAQPPAGFTTPASGANMVGVTVQQLTVTAPNVTVGQGLETTATVSIAPSVAQTNQTVTITSTDPSKVLFSTDPTVAGTASIQITLRGGSSNAGPFYVFGLASSGSVSYTVNVPTIGAGTGTVTLGPSGIVLSGPAGPGNDFTTTTGAAASFLDVSTFLLDGGGNPVAAQNVAGGFTATVTVTSGSPSVGTITTSPLTITAGNSSATTMFQPSATQAGTSRLTATASAPFNGTSIKAALTATVVSPKILVSGDSVGNSLSQQASIFLPAAAPAGGLNVTLAVTSGAALVSATGTNAGGATAVVNIPAGSFGGSFFIYGGANTGTATVTASAPGFVSGTVTVNLVPSGIAIAGPFGFGFNLSTSVAQGDQPVSVSTVKLDPSEGVGTQPLKGGTSLTVTLQNSNPSVGTVPGTVTIAGGTDTGTVSFHPITVGSTLISVVQPAGFTAPVGSGFSYTTLEADVH